MFPTFKKWFVPCSENDFLPYMLRVTPFIFLSFFIGVTFITSSTLEQLLSQKNSFLGAVVSSVLVDLTNGDRANEGLLGLAVNPLLVDAAQRKANDMAARGYFSHNTPEGKTPWFWFNEVGDTFSYAGENLAVFFGDSADVERAWMNSPSHRANIMNGSFTEIGIATAEGYYQGQKTVFVVQMFGTPAVQKSLATLVTNVPTEKEAGVGEVGGETAVSITAENSTPAPNEPRVLFEDDTFIAVKDDTHTDAPSLYLVAPQSNMVERALGSPHTALSYVYGTVGFLILLALIFFVFLEFRIQRPVHVGLSVLLLLFIGVLYYLTSDAVVLAAGL